MSVWGIPSPSGFDSVIWMNSSQDKRRFLVEFICWLTGTSSSVWPLLPGCLEPAKKLWPFGLSILGNAVNAKAAGKAFILSLCFFFFAQQWYPQQSLYWAGCSPSKNNPPFLKPCLFGVGEVMWVGKGRKFLPLTPCGHCRKLQPCACECCFLLPSHILALLNPKTKPTPYSKRDLGNEGLRIQYELHLSSWSAEGEGGKPSPPSVIGVLTFSVIPLMELQAISCFQLRRAWCYKDSMYR